MITLRPENLRRTKGVDSKGLHIMLSRETREQMSRHVPARPRRGGGGVTSSFVDLGVRVLCTLLSGEGPEMDDLAEALSRALGDEDEDMATLGELSRRAMLLSNALDRHAHKARWAMSEAP